MNTAVKTNLDKATDYLQSQDYKALTKEFVSADWGPVLEKSARVLATVVAAAWLLVLLSIECVKGTRSFILNLSDQLAFYARLLTEDPQLLKEELTEKSLAFLKYLTTYLKSLFPDESSVQGSDPD